MDDAKIKRALEDVATMFHERQLTYTEAMTVAITLLLSAARQARCTLPVLTEMVERCWKDNPRITVQS